MLTIFTVDTLDDVVSAADNVTSLREAILAANSQPGADTIEFSSTVNGTFTLTLGALNITDTLTIQGNSSKQTVLDADGRSRVIHFEAATGNLTLNDLAIRNGDDVSFFGGGGVAFDSSGQLTISNCDVSGNRSASNGGGIRLESGSLTLTNSTVSGNIALFNGGGISSNSGAMTLINSTISGNGGFFDGGGLATQSGSINLLNSTVAFNSAYGGGGIFLFASGISLSATNSIIARNSIDSADLGPDVLFSEGTPVTLNHTLIGDNTGTTLTASATADASGNLIGSAISPIDPLLGALTDNGGPTRSHALLTGSPVLNAGSNDAAQDLLFDQRGTPFARKFGEAVDMGAIEALPLTFTVTTNSDGVNTQDGQTSLREAIAAANGNPGADTIVFAQGLSGPILMTGGEFDMTDTVTIQGNGSGQTVVDAQQNSRVFRFTASTGDLNLSGLTIRNGNALGTAGGGIRFDSSGTMSLTNSTVSGNTATSGGGLFTNYGSISLTNSTVSGNTAVTFGGGLHSTSGSILLTNSTVSGNTANGGGGLRTYSGTISLTNSTVSGNTASSSGGGLRMTSGSLALTNSTVSGNTAKYGGGAYLFGSSASLTATNSIVAGNSLTTGGSGPDVMPKNGGLITLNHSLIGDSSGTTMVPSATADSSGNLIGSAGSPIDPLLGPLADNGGPTLTHALLPGSPALNAGSNTGAQGLPFDQRGASFSRIVGLSVDMGAFEFQTAQAGTITVTTNSDVVDAADGQTSLREAIAAANGNPGADTIVFAQGLSGPIVMTGGEFVMTDTVTIQGHGSGQTVVDAQQNSRVFHFTASTGDLNLSGLTIQNGKVSDSFGGGGIRFDSSGTISLINSTVSGNNSINGGGLLANFGTISLTNSTVSGNTATSGGGLYTTSGTISLTNSTVSGNTANFGGGLFANFGTISLTNSTVSGNTAKYGGGAYLFGSSASLTATNSIVAGNSLTAGGSGPDVMPKNGGLITLNHSLIGDSSGTTMVPAATADSSGNLIGSAGSPIDPLLGPLADNGGPTQTHALLAGSRALNAGSNTGVQGLPFDQRGASFSRIVGLSVDMGAFEFQTAQAGTITVTTNSDVVDAADGQTSLREAIAAANGNPGADTIVFAQGLSGPILMTEGEFVMTDTVTIQGNGSGQTAVDAQQNSRVFHFTAATGDLNLSGLTIRNGHVSFDAGGGGIRFDSSGTISLTNSAVSGNTADIGGSGGGLFSRIGPISLTNSTVSGNTASNFGGGLYAYSGTISLTNSTVSSNTAKYGGGAFLLESSASLTATNSIVAGNSLTAGGRGPDVMPKNGGSITLNHTLIGDNSGTTLVPSATADSSGNLIGSSVSPIDPLLGLLADNGGPTKTHKLLVGSPALNAGSNSGAQGLQFDQRGASFPRIFGLSVDMGAFESQEALSLTITVTTNTDVVDAQDGQTSLREAIAAANGNPGADTIVFAQGLSGPILMTGGEFDMTDTVTIQGNGSGQTVVDAQQNSRVFHFTASTGDLNLSGLTIQNGQVSFDAGGGIRFDSSGTISLTNSTVSANTADFRGGGVFTFDGSISLTNSTISGNTANFEGGGLMTYFGSISVRSSTISGNTGFLGGGLYAGDGSISLANSTVSGNMASYGGGLHTGYGSISLSNSTVSGNTAKYGGGLRTLEGSISLTNSTVSGNTAMHGGGAYLSGSLASLTATNSIVAGNSLTAGGSGPDVMPQNGGSITLNHTLIGDNSGTTLVPSATPDASGNLIGSTASPIDPLLEPLANNGGPTLTHALLVGSPATNAGSNVAAQGLQFDQRGQSFARIFSGTVDMGAFEFSVPNVSFGTSSSAVSEGTATTTITVNLSFASLNAVTIPFTISGTASIQDDVNITTNSLVIPAGQTSGTITINVVNDSLDELDETVIVTLGTPTNAILSGTSVHTLTIQDNDAPPTVSFESVGQSVNEDAGTVTLTLELIAASSFEVVVPFTVGGTADSSDFAVAASSVVIPAGQTTGTITINVVNDSLDENDETVIVTLGTPTHATLGTNSTHTLTIADDDTNAAPTIPAGQVFSVAENSAANATVGIVSASDNENDALSFSILMGEPSNPFTIDTATGQLSVSSTGPSLDFELTPTYVLQVQVTDTANNTSLQSVTVNLTDVAEAPVIVGGGAVVTYFKKNRQPVSLFPQLTISSTDAPASLRKLIISYSVPRGGSAADVVTNFTPLGQVEVSGPLDFRRQPGTRTLTVTFNADITIAQVQDAIRGIKFATKKLDTKNRSLNRTISLHVVDDQGNSSNTVTNQIRAFVKAT